MKLLFLFLWICLFCTTGLYAQAYIDKAELRGVKRTAAVTRLSYGADPVEDAVKQYMMTKGFKSTSVSGSILFRGVPMDIADTSQSDLYFRADVPSRKEKDMTVLSLIPAKKNQDLATGIIMDSARLEKARLFLDSLAPFVIAYNVRLAINNQQEILAKAQKKMNGLKSDSTDLKKKIRNLQSDLDRNQKDQEKAVADLKSSINADDETKGKYQKRVNKLLDEEASLQKKLRSAQQDMEDNKNDMEKQQEEVNKQRQGLEAVKSRRGTN